MDQILRSQREVGEKENRIPPQEREKTILLRAVEEIIDSVITDEEQRSEAKRLLPQLIDKYSNAWDEVRETPELRHEAIRRRDGLTAEISEQIIKSLGISDEEKNNIIEKIGRRNDELARQKDSVYDLGK